MSATGLSHDAAAALAANLKLFQAELELFSAGVVFAAAVGRLQEARAAAALQSSAGSAATAAGISAREAQIQRVADAFRMPARATRWTSRCAPCGSLRASSRRGSSRPCGAP